MGGTGNDHGTRTGGPRLIALIGSFQSGKTKLFEALLERTGATREGAGVGDASPEARAHQMSVEANIGHADYLGDQYTFIDLPGSMEFAHEARNVLPLVDAAVVVCEADPRKVFSLQLVLRELEELRVPRFLFVNKIDAASLGVRETLAMLQPASRTPLLARQMPIWKNGVAIGFIDLALERAYVYREHALSEVVAIPSGDAAREKEQRYSMLERLADYDDALMEELISDIEPPRDQVFDDLAKELREGLVVPLFFGSAARGAGVTRLLKALRHELPGIETTRARLGVSDKGPALARVLRTIHTSHGGKLSLARVLRGTFVDGHSVLSPGGEDKISGVSRLLGGAPSKRSEALEGDTLAFGRLEHAATGDSITGDPRGGIRDVAKSPVPAPEPVHAVALKVKDRKDEMKLASAIAKLVDEDPSLIYLHDQELSEIKLLGQGEMHLRVALERLASRFGVTVEVHKPTVAYKETIRTRVLGARAPQETVRRARPIRRCRAGSRAARARRGLCLFRAGAWRLRAAAIFLLGRGRLPGRAGARAARLSGGRRRGRADGRLLSLGRFVRHGLSHGGARRHERGSLPGGIRAAGARAGGDDLHAQRGHVARHRHRFQPTRPNPGVWPSRGLGRLGAP